MITKWMVFRDWLRAQFWHKISAVSVPNMPDVALVRIRPRLIARVLNYIRVDDLALRRSINRYGNVVWQVVKGTGAGSYAARQLTTYRVLERAFKLGSIEDEYMPNKEDGKMHVVKNDDPANHIQN